MELRNNSGYLPLHEAVLFQHLGEFINLHITAVQGESKFNWSQNSTVSFSFSLDSVNYLLKCHCDVNVRNNQGFTPLHLATSVGSIAVCEILLQTGAAVNCITTQCKASRLPLILHSALNQQSYRTRILSSHFSKKAIVDHPLESVIISELLHHI